MEDLLNACVRIEHRELQMFAESENDIRDRIHHELAHSMANSIIEKMPMTSECNFNNYTTYTLSFAALTRERYIELLKAEQDLREVRRILG